MEAAVPRFFFSIVVLMLLAVPATATPLDEERIFMPLGPVQLFVVNNTVPLTFTYDEASDFGVARDLGDIDYDLVSNTGWEVSATINDIDSDWDDVNWTLSVNGTVIDISGVVIDTDPNPVERYGALWEVLLIIPWPESISNPECEIIMTATEL